MQRAVLDCLAAKHRALEGNAARIIGEAGKGDGDAALMRAPRLS